MREESRIIGLECKGWASSDGVCCTLEPALEHMHISATCTRSDRVHWRLHVLLILHPATSAPFTCDAPAQIHLLRIRVPAPVLAHT